MPRKFVPNHAGHFLLEKGDKKTQGPPQTHKKIRPKIKIQKKTTKLEGLFYGKHGVRGPAIKCFK